MATTQWKQGNTKKYVEVQTGSNIDVSIEFKNYLQAGEELYAVDFTTTSSDLTIINEVIRHDESLGFTRPHQIMCYVRPTALGTHPVKALAQTNQGRTYVYHFDIYTKQ